jgi:transcriptional regulator with XRE-family HTH domain
MSKTTVLPLEPDLPEWGRRLTRYRKEQDLSQVELAERLARATGQKLDQSYVSKIERGVRPPTDAQKTALARILKTTVWLLFPYPDDLR